MYISCLITLQRTPSSIYLQFWARKFQTFQYPHFKNEGKDQEWMKGLEIALIILNSHRHGRKKILEKIWGSFDRHEIELQSLLILKETTQSFRAEFHWISVTRCVTKLSSITTAAAVIFIQNERSQKGTFSISSLLLIVVYGKVGKVT